MAEQLDPVVFIPFGGMNQEDSYFNPAPDANGRSAFQQGDFRYAQNVRTGSSRSDNLGDAEILVSSLEVTAYKVWSGSAWIDGAKPSGSNFPVGKHEDKQLRKVFYIQYNDANNHTICEYRAQSKTVYELLRWNGLNLQRKYVSMSRIGNYLVFTDKINKPRIIDFTAIYTLKSTLAAKFCEFHISFSKWAPVAPPVCKFVLGAGVGTAELKKGIFQFSYRYVYIGGFRSRWSPTSECVSNMYLNGNIGNITLTHPGLIYNSLDPDDSKNHQDQEFYQVVDFIEFAFRASSIDVWRVFKTIKPTVPSDLMTSIFRNRTVGTPISQDDFSQEYDEVPLAAAATEVIDNRVMFGNNNEEYPFVDDIDFVENVETYSASPQSAWLRPLPKTAFVGFRGLSTQDDADLTDRNKIRQHTYKSRGIYKHAVVFRDESGKKSLGYTTDSWINYIPDSTPDGVALEKIFACGFKFKDSFKPPIWAKSYEIVRTNCLNIDYFIFGVANAFKPQVDDTVPTDDQVTTPQGSRDVINDYYNFNKNDIPESSITRINFGENERQLLLYRRMMADTRKTKVISSFADASRIYIDINNWYNAAKNTGVDKNFPLNKIYYEFQEGDYIRFYGSTVSTPTSDQVNIYDLPILEFTGRAIIVEKPVGLLWAPDVNAAESQFAIEIYRPKKVLKETDLIYYGMGEWYPVTKPGTDDRDFLKRNWTWSNQDSVTAIKYKNHVAYSRLPLISGDCHSIVKTFYYNWRTSTYNGDFICSTTSMNPDKDRVFDRWERNNGRPTTTYSVKPLVAFKETQVRFGGKYYQDALFNNINNFIPRDQFLYPQEYGSITEMINTTSYQVESVGSILLTLFSVKSVSIYVNRTTLEDLSGRTQVMLSEKVLGAYNSLLGDYGCINPESISYSNNGNVYWWDQLSGNWMRYGRDGNTPISEAFKMTTWFKEMADLLDPLYTDESQPWIISEFDQYHGELLVYMQHTSLPSSFRGYTNYKGMVFSEKRNQWKYSHNYTADFFAKINNQVIGFTSNTLYIHEKGSDFLKIYGTKQDARIEPVFNIAPASNKIWQTITEISSHKWSIERMLSEYFGSRVEQESNLTDLSLLKEKEGSFVAAILNDKNSPTFTNQDEAVIKGEKMRSKIIRVLLKLDGSISTRSLLHMVLIGSTDSPKNP